MSLENLSLDFLKEKYSDIVKRIEESSNELLTKMAEFADLKKQLEEIDKELERRKDVSEEYR